MLGVVELCGLGGHWGPAQDQSFTWDKPGNRRGGNLSPAVILLPIPRALAAAKCPIPCPAPRPPSPRGCYWARPCHRPHACLHSQRTVSLACPEHTVGVAGARVGCRQGRGAAPSTLAGLHCMSSLARAALLHVWARVFWARGASSLAQAACWEGWGAALAVGLCGPWSPRSPQAGNSPLPPAPAFCNRSTNWYHMLFIRIYVRATRDMPAAGGAVMSGHARGPPRLAGWARQSRGVPDPAQCLPCALEVAALWWSRGR